MKKTLSWLLLLIMLLGTGGVLYVGNSLFAGSGAEVPQSEQFELESTGVSPQKLTFNVGEKLQIYVRFSTMAGYSLEDYEYSVLRLGNGPDAEWETAIDFVPFPSQEDATHTTTSGAVYLCDYAFDTTGLISLGVTVRNRETGQEQHLWAGQFQVGDYDQSLRTNLIKSVLVAYPDLQDDRLYDALVEDLPLIVSYFVGQYVGMTAVEWAEAQGLREIGDGRYAGPGGTSRMQAVDTEEQRFEYEGFSVSADLSDYPGITSALAALNGQSDEFILAALLNYLVYCNYDYGNAYNPLNLYTPHDDVAHCAIYAKDLFQLLSRLGYPVRQWGVRFANEATHELCEVEIDGRWYSFDPTTDVIFTSTVDSIYIEGTQAIMLPQLREMFFLIEKPYWEELAVMDLKHEANV